MSTCGGVQAALLLLAIVCFCFSVGSPGPRRTSSDLLQVAAMPVDDGCWSVELRLMCQPSERPDPSQRRPRLAEPDEDEEAHALNGRAQGGAQLAEH